MVVKRGRPSAADLATVVEGSFGDRPEPPEGFTEHQEQIWRATVASEPAEFFNTAALRYLLADFCRHRDSIDILAGRIDAFDPDWMKNQDGVRRYKWLLAMRAMETKATMMLATKLRLTN